MSVDERVVKCLSPTIVTKLNFYLNCYGKWFTIALLRSEVS